MIARELFKKMLLIDFLFFFCLNKCSTKLIYSLKFVIKKAFFNLFFHLNLLEE